MKQYVGFVRDHSQSMHPIAKGAAKDYNVNLSALQTAARETGLDTILNVVECGVGWDAKVVRKVVNSNIYVVEPLAENKYETSGSGTPLFQSVNEVISLMKNVPDANDPQVSFLVMVITDGQENASVHGSRETMIANISTLQATDRWTFVFRVPRGDKGTLTRFGVPEGNILEWDQTERGFEIATASTQSAVASYYTGRTRGATSTTKFYADLHNVTPQMAKNQLDDISSRTLLNVVQFGEDGMAIKDWSIKLWGQYQIGFVYYELVKPETIQSNKKIIIRNKNTGKKYTGPQARVLLGLPSYGDAKVHPGNLGEWTVYVQSTSVNRKVVVHSGMIYYKG